jgi:glutamine amidotransferase
MKPPDPKSAGRATVIDAGVGNLGNLARALGHLGAEVEITDDPAVIAASRRLLLPGVGAFRPPRERLRGAAEEALARALEQGAWLLGICVGYQLLFESSEEFGATDGLGLLPGTVRRLPDDVPLPHIGWNRLETADGERHPLLSEIPAGSHVYFVHSYAPLDVPEDARLATCLHGARFTAVAGRGRLLGTQFHPEKSGATGLRLLANFLALGREEEPCG